MAKAKLDLEISHTLRVVAKPPEAAIVVPKSQWSTIMGRIMECQHNPDKYTSFAWACFGVAAGALIAAITFPFSVSFVEHPEPNIERLNYAAYVTEGLCISLSAIGVIAWILAANFAKRHQSDQTKLRDWIVQDMRAIQERQTSGDDQSLSPAA